MNRKRIFAGSTPTLSGFMAIIAILLTSLAVMALGSVDPVIDFEPPYLPEGIAVDKTGNIYVSMANQSELRMITPGGAESVLATLPTGGFGLLGLAVDAPGNIYAGLATADGVTNGVYRISDDGATERLPGSVAILVPNALVFDKQGSLYVTDTVLGAVWRIPRGGAAELWIQDELLVGTGFFGYGVPLGANGIAYRHDVLYVANTEKAHIVRIAVNTDGSPGTPEVLVADPQLLGIDGLALDVHGDLYAAIVSDNKLIRVNMDDATLSLLATEGLDNPASLAFGSGRGDRQSIFITNFALLSQANPGVVKYDAGVPGWPLP